MVVVHIWAARVQVGHRAVVAAYTAVECRKVAGRRALADHKEAARKALVSTAPLLKELARLQEEHCYS